MQTDTPGRLLEDLRKRQPLVHYMGNFVTMGFVANGLLGLGARPVMALAAEEVAAIAAGCDALVLNAGTPTRERLDTWGLATREAAQRGIPVLLDPVGAGASPWRRERLEAFLEVWKPGIIRGNYVEIAALVNSRATHPGVDAPPGGEHGDGATLASTAARSLATVVAVTGEVDFVSDGRETLALGHGHPWLRRVTGAGCLLTGIMAAFAAVEPRALTAAAAGLACYGRAAEIAGRDTAGPGTFAGKLLDTLYGLDTQDLQPLRCWYPRGAIETPE